MLDAPADLLCESNPRGAYAPGKVHEVYHCALQPAGMFEPGITRIEIDPKSVTPRKGSTIKIGASESRGTPWWIVGINLKKGTECTISGKRDEIACKMPARSKKPAVS